MTINFMTVIGSILLSTITATIITIYINRNFLKYIGKQTDNFLNEVREINLEIFKKLNNK